MTSTLSRLLLTLLVTAALSGSQPLFAAKQTGKDNDGLQNEIDSINLQLDYLKLKLSDSLKKRDNWSRASKTSATKLPN